MAAVTIMAFFANREAARAAVAELRRKGLPRSGLVHKARAGSIQLWDPFPKRRFTRILLAAVVAGGLAALGAAVGLPAPGPGRLVPMAAVPAAALAASLATGLWFRRSRYGVDRRLLNEHARRLVADETVLVLHAPLESLASAVGLLREAGEIPPVVFYLHPKRAGQLTGERKGGVSLPQALIEEHAVRVATGHRLLTAPRPNRELLDRLERSRQSIHEACADLSAASPLEQSPPVAEWILDNEYVIEANARDVELNLPRRYYQQLPALSDQSDRSLPSAYTRCRRN
jgi:cyclic beta-1,2-glucan synthetase